jgi:hypothetical protein
VIDEMVALLGSHVEALGVSGLLKELRLRDVVGEMRRAYGEQGRDWGIVGAGWHLVQALSKAHLLKARLALVRTKEEHQTLQRRQVQMQCQAFLNEYKDDEDYCEMFRADAAAILLSALEHKGSRNTSADVCGIMRTATAWACDMRDMVQTAGDIVLKAMEGACRSKGQPLVRVIDLLDSRDAIAKAAQCAADELFNPEQVLPLLVEKAFQTVAAGIRSEVQGVSPLGTCLNEVIKFRGKLGFTKSFDDAFFARFQPLYTELGKQPSAEKIHNAATEWAIAYCEQLKLDLPPWMMSKDQREALRRLQEAVNSGEEGQLREAVIFAKQTDVKADPKLENLYNESMNQLRKLKRLPTTWAVADLVGDDPTAKMFRKADVDDPAVKLLFQKLFDDTNAGIVTRDRVGAIPRGYKVPPMVDEANEFLMFHGTKPDAADLIAQNHFDMGYVCKTGLFGAGLYFAEASSKADEYVKPDDKDQFPVILARVTLGRVNYCPKVDPTTDPGRKALESSCLGGGFHCVLGDRKKVRGTYREFIVYDHYQVYPHFIVYYKREQ